MNYCKKAFFEMGGIECRQDGKDGIFLRITIEKMVWLVFLCLLVGGAERKYQETVRMDRFQNKFLVESFSTQWRMLEGEYAMVYYRENAEEARMILDLADSYFPMVARDFSWNRKEKVEYVLYDDSLEMKQALQMKEEDALPMGAYYHGAAAVLSPSLWAKGNEDWQRAEEFIENGPVVHEMLHFAMDEVSKGRYPHWFSEGVALYYEKKYTGFEWAKEEKAKSKEITMEELYHGFDKLNPALAYRKSYDWVRGFVSQYGEDALQELIRSGKMCLRP